MAETEQIEGSLAHPGYTTVKVMGGSQKATIRKWTMAQRAELKPKLAQLLQRVGAVQGLGEATGLSDLFTKAEDELVEICKVCVELPDDVKFDELFWEDLPNLVQGIWETNLVTADGGGIAGKLSSLVVPYVVAAVKASQAIAKSSQSAEPSPPTSPSGQKLQGSPS